MPRGWFMDAHQHPFWEFLLVVKGTHQVSSQGADATAAPGTFLFYPPGVPHAERNPQETPAEIWYLAFEGGSPEIEAMWCGYDRDGRLREMMEWLHAERDGYGPCATGFRDAVVQALWMECRRIGQQAPMDLVDAVRRHAQANLADPLRLDDLARAAGLSKYHFVRTYRRLTGLTPMQDLRRIRLEQARRLLVSTQLPLKVIASRVGIRDEYQLSRALKRCLGMSPRAIRTRSRA